MRLNGNTLKVVLAFVVIVGVVFWAVNSVRPRSYSGPNLSFDTAGGIIVVTNPSNDPTAAQFIGSGSRTFRVSSTIEGVTGSSTRVGDGSARTQQFEFELPPGTNEFTVSSGTEIQFVAETDTDLQATVNPMSSEMRRNTLIATAVVVGIALFYASNVVNHRWLNVFRPNTIAPRAEPSASPSIREVQGKVAQSYGDNRGKD